MLRNALSWSLITLVAAVSVTASTPEAPAPELATAVATGVSRLLEMQEGGKSGTEWPYEGVYRVRGVIPIGYRIGGTGIVGMSLLAAPASEDDTDRLAAIHRATQFVVSGPDEPLMQFEDIKASYDVRGWGYAYGLWFLVDLESRDLVPEALADDVKAAIRFYIEGIKATEIPGHGGWNYARRGGFDKAGPPSPFMTGSTLHALFAAARQGYAVSDEVIERGLDMLEAARTASGSYVYSGKNGERSRESVPGSVGRMLVSECTLHLAGRSSPDRLRGAIDAFIVHWEWLEKRRRKDGTHKPPYGIAPYYFYYAHYFAAEAIELLPKQEREEYRRRYREILFRTRADDGTWNDRVFPRSANYGTAMSVLSLMMPEMPAPAGWAPEKAESE